MEQRYFWVIRVVDKQLDRLVVLAIVRAQATPHTRHYMRRSRTDCMRLEKSTTTINSLKTIQVTHLLRTSKFKISASSSKSPNP